MRVPVLKTVANPPKLLLAPFMLGIGNFVVQAALLVISLGFDVNPLLFLATIAIGHILMIILGSKDQHLAKILVSSGKFSKKSLNIYKCKGNKLAP